jgi:hypothetical protein
LPVMNVFSAVAREFLAAFIFNYRFIPVFVIVVLFIKIHHEKYVALITNAADKPVKKIWESLQEVIFYGAVTAFAAGVVLILLGVTFKPIVFDYMIVIMSVFFLFNTRYMCIAYAGGILALVTVIFKIPDINITSLLVLISVLQAFESILIYVGAGKSCEPVYIRHDEGIAGAFITKKIWPIPIIFAVFLTQEIREIMSNTITVNWWTLFKPETLYAGTIALGLDCSVSVLSYDDMTITMPPEKKNRVSAIMLMVYSGLLFIIAVLSRNMAVFKLLGAIFALVGHEAIYLYNRYVERHREALFVPVRRGVRVLDVLPESNACKMGMKRGDIILSINNMDVQTEEGIAEALRKAPNYVWVKILNVNGQEKVYEYKCFPEGIDKLGIIIVPRENEVTYNVRYYGRFNILKNLVKRFRGDRKSI